MATTVEHKIEISIETIEITETIDLSSMDGIPLQP